MTMNANLAATVTASTKRPPAVSGGKVGSPATNLASVMVVPLLPLGEDLAQEAQLKSTREGKLTYAFPATGNTLPDIVEGDLLVVAGVEYLVKLVKEWQRDSDGSCLEIVLSLRKGAA